MSCPRGAFCWLLWMNLSAAQCLLRLPDLRPFTSRAAASWVHLAQLLFGFRTALIVVIAVATLRPT
jgi:hypothetical protein